MTVANQDALTWENFDNRLRARFYATSAVQLTERVLRSAEGHYVDWKVQFDIFGKVTVR